MYCRRGEFQFDLDLAERSSREREEEGEENREPHGAPRIPQLVGEESLAVRPAFRSSKGTRTRDF